MNYEAAQVEVEVRGKKVKAWAVVDEAGTVKRAYTSRLIGDPQGGAEAYAAELNATLPPPERTSFQDPTFGESFSAVEPHHVPEGFDPACSFLLALNEVNLFTRDGECKGCGARVKEREYRSHRDEHRAAVSALRKAGKDKAQGKKEAEDLSRFLGDDATGLATVMREHGQSYQAIADELERRGILTKRGKEKWSTTAVMRLLK